VATSFAALFHFESVIAHDHCYHALVIAPVGIVGTKCRGALLPLYAGGGKATMQSQRDVWNTPYFHDAIRKKIGNALSSKYDLSLPLPEPIRGLLDRLDEPSAQEDCGG
jgi:hypothetical protein